MENGAVVGQGTSIGRDIYVGATTVVASTCGHREAAYVSDLIFAGGTVVCFVPSALCALAEHVLATAAEQHSLATALGARGPRPRVRLAVSCGEDLPRSTTDLFFRASRGAVLNNVYGPTEAEMTFFEMDRREPTK